MRFLTVTSLLTFLILHPLFLSAQDQSHYPDTIIDAYNTVTKSRNEFFGGTGTDYRRLVPLHVLLHPSDTFVSLPTGSYVVVGFTDNYILDAPNQPDIYIEEIAGAGEFADIYVSADNKEYIHLGVAGNGVVNKFDLAGISYDKPVSYIKIIGKDAKGQSPGFDVGKIIALPGANKPRPVILKNVLFHTNQFELLPASFVSLDALAKALLENTSMHIEIRGHTDSVGNNQANQLLSEQRAQSVFTYLVSKGIDANRLSVKGFGSSEPIASNHTEAGRKQNRRVEFVRTK